MPKQKTDKPLTDKQKIRQLEQDIKEMQRDFKETFAVLEKDKPKKKKGRALLAAVVIVIILLAAAYVYTNYLM